MKSSLLLGIISGFAIILIVIFTKENVSYFLNLSAFGITVGGTMAAILIYFSFNDIKCGIQSFINIFREKDYSAKEIMNTIIDLNKKAHKEGVVNIINHESARKIPFLYEGLQLVADNTDPEHIREILLKNTRAITRRNNIGENVFYIAGSIAPMFGMMGTVIGLIAMLNRIKEPSAIPSAMGLALVTTLYGLILSALILKPISGKIRVKNQRNTRLRLLVMEGILAIQRGENSKILEEKLKSFLD
ncbi:MAG: motility protein A [Candidatus Cloacimonadota bacterium]|nr:MAG: motility protein A [Candidatus Cloacimonadota bacterium]